MKTLFGVPLWHFRDFLNNEELLLCHNEIDSISSTIKQLNIHESMSGVEFDLSIHETLIRSKINELFQKINPNVTVQSYWISESKPNTSVVSHNHINPNDKMVMYSAVYYLAAENSGNLYLENPDQFGKLFNENRYKITPKTNDLIIFPGWVNHWVDINTSDITRRCVAFDLVID